MSEFQHNKRWLVSDPLSAAASQTLNGFPLALQGILFSRGYATHAEARRFLAAEVAFDTSPWQMKNMRRAVERIAEAVQRGEKIVIYGDYDVDGVTATVLLVEALRALGANVSEYIPRRLEEGYGLNNEALSLLKEQGAALVISVDCGIRSPVEAEHARAIGLDLIISDHHEPAGEIPSAYAVLNPKQPGDEYPEKYLAGVGIAYKIAEALRAEYAAPNLQLESLLDLVALGTVADLAPLNGENRALVRGGLRQMRRGARPGIVSLAAVAKISLTKVTAMDIGFGLGPRLNAAGRLDTALDSYRLLISREISETGLLAQQLDGQNRERQTLTREIQSNAETLALAEDPSPLILFAADPGFNPGIVGLAAARLAERYYRPAIVGHMDGEFTRCSCRSIAEFHITKALDECADLLQRHGGHAAAAGFTVANENWPALKEHLRQIAARQLTGLDLRQTLRADAEVRLSDLNFDLLKKLDYLEPTGYGNPGAVFVARNLRVLSKRPVGADGKHLKLALGDDGQIIFDAIAFRFGEQSASLPQRVDVMFTLENNEYNGQNRLQLNVKDLKPAGTPD
ncbi:MAG: single-stranded-DNA-specific exonuclease RecJ [Anaerolineales bacterium]